MAIIDDTAPPKKGPSLLMQIALLVGLTVAALGIGWGSGLYLSGGHQQAAKPADAGAKVEEVRLGEALEAMGVVYLEPITTNLAGPASTWVRMELALVFDGKIDLSLAQAVQQDILAYLRTVKMHQVEGPSGYQHLISDLEERASIRSAGKVKQVLVKTLLFE